jgi:hypothetical protein
MFGGQNNQQAQGGSLFGQTTQPANKSPFSGFGVGANNGNTNTQSTNSLWGNNQTATTPGWNSNANTAASLSWGVNVNQGNQNLGSSMNKGPTTTVVPVKSKNTKIDNKHLVKCVAALDQYNGLTK